ncbi:MAG: leucine-rich repeat protein [Dysgonamonadaceae bacterium]|jgi:hypothetical protein|nr:leucine-rich repeat protein [Dysgonamonadaceae bacterium]
MKKITCIFVLSVLCFCAFTNKVAGQIWVGSLVAENAEGKMIYYDIVKATETAPLTACVVQSYSNNEYFGEITIPESVTFESQTCPVTAIGNYAFSDCRNLTSITLPATVTSIGYRAFYNCYNLSSITIPESVTSIDGDAFEYTAWLQNQPVGVLYVNNILYKYVGTIVSDPDSGYKTIHIRQGTTTICDYAFANQTLLDSIFIPNTVTHIGYRAFYNCSKLSFINVSSTLMTTRQEAFHNTKWWIDRFDGPVYLGNMLYAYKGTMPPNTSIDIPDGVTSINNWAFSDYNTLKSVNIPNSVILIGDAAFIYSALETVNLGNVSSIGAGAFYNCIYLKTLTIPESVTSIGNSAFCNCESLTSVNFNAKNCETAASSDDWLYATFRSSKLTAINIGNRVTRIPDYIFYDCTAIKEVVIPESVTRIGKYAFWSCPMTSITCKAVIPPVLGSASFNSSKIPVIIPCESYYDYKNSQWGNYFINFNNTDWLQEICMVSVDENNHSQIVWKRNREVVSYNIYREGARSGQYDLIANVPSDDVNVYTDGTSADLGYASQYKVLGVDSCGVENLHSNPHTTIHLSINQGGNNHWWNLIWTPYIGIEYDAYNIYRSTNGAAGMQLLATIPGSRTSYTDFYAPVGDVYYVVEIVPKNLCADETQQSSFLLRSNASLSTIRSNIATNVVRTTGIEDKVLQEINLYPNPVKEAINISGIPENAMIEITDLSGRTVGTAIYHASKNSTETINVVHLPAGVYIVKIGNYKAKFVKQ